MVAKPEMNWKTDKPHLGSRNYFAFPVRSGAPWIASFASPASWELKRNLAAGEIVGQIAAVLNDQHVAPPRDRVTSCSWGWENLF